MQKIWEKYGNIWENIRKWWFIASTGTLGSTIWRSRPISSCSLLQGFVNTSTVIYSFCQLFPFFPSWTILYPLHPMVFVNDLSATGSGFASGKLAFQTETPTTKLTSSNLLHVVQPTQNWQNNSLSGLELLSMEDPTEDSNRQKNRWIHRVPCFPKKWRPSSSHQLFWGIIPL